MKKGLQIFLGIILIIIPLLVAIFSRSWGKATLQLIQGGIIVVLIAIGVILLVLSIIEK